MERKFELFMGCLGNGITVCNKAVCEHGDYKHIAHISDHGKIKLYVSTDYIPSDAMARIKEAANSQRKEFAAQWCLVPIMSKYAILLNQLSIAEFTYLIKQNDWGIEAKVAYAELIVYGVLSENLISAIYPFRDRWDIANQMIQKADCEQEERIKAIEWLKKFHDDSNTEKKM